MTTFLYKHDIFYADTRAYVNGQPFNISGKVVPLTKTVPMKAKLNDDIEMDDVILGYFVVHAVEPGRALFKTLVAGANENNGDVQNVLDNHRQFLQIFKLGAYESHFTLTLIGVKGTYSILTPRGMEDETRYEVAYYENDETNTALLCAYGAHHEVMSSLAGAGLPPIIAYYMLFLKQEHSGGNVESWMIREFHDEMMLVRHQFYPEVSKEKMLESIKDWQKNPSDYPIAEMSAVYDYGPGVLNGVHLENYLTNQGYELKRDDKGVVTHLVQEGKEPVSVTKEYEDIKFEKGEQAS
jgi:hypothetical protein